MTNAIDPFRIDVRPEGWSDLRDRLARTRWPEPATVPDWSQGVPLDYLRDLCAYWADGYDWPATVARLNRLPQFTTMIDGVRVHFVHLRSGRPGAVPLILTHGWPGSFLEFERTLGPLTDPQRHGGGPDDAFDVVVPSLPGYGFSSRPETAGWDIHRIARAWAELMSRLGYHRFVAAGSDWGTSISTSLALQFPDRLIGLHLIPPLVAPDLDPPGGLTEPEATAPARPGRAQPHRIRVLGDARHPAADPGVRTVGLAGRVVRLDRGEDLDLGRPRRRPGTGARTRPDPGRRHPVLDDRDGSVVGAAVRESIAEVSAWFTTATTDTIQVPTGCSVFAKEVPRPSLRWAGRRFSDIVHWGEPQRGGHFAAWEVPDLFVDEVRAVGRALRRPS